MSQFQKIDWNKYNLPELIPDIEGIENSPLSVYHSCTAAIIQTAFKSAFTTKFHATTNSLESSPI